MRRRTFISLAAGATIWPLAARAQQSTKLPTIGFLGAITPTAQGYMVAALVQRLRELGWIEGRTITIEYRWAEGRSERYSEIVDEFFVLEGELTVETRAPDDCRVLGIGERFRVNAQHAHQTVNRGAKDCRFLIVQGVGKYDFKRLPAGQNAETRTEGA